MDKRLRNLRFSENLQMGLIGFSLSASLDLWEMNPRRAYVWTSNIWKLCSAMLGQTYYINIHRFQLFFMGGPVFQMVLSKFPKWHMKSWDLNAYAPISHSEIPKIVSGTCMESWTISIFASRAISFLWGCIIFTTPEVPHPNSWTPLGASRFSGQWHLGLILRSSGDTYLSGSTTHH